jgi:hypothetical protein
LAFDSAADTVYDDGWQNGDNGGYGWGGGWVALFSPYNFIASSTTNGSGDPGDDGDIDTQGRSWAMYTLNPGPISHEATFAIRPFDGGLTLGQQFVIDIDTGPSGGFGSGFVSVALRDSGTNQRFVLTGSAGGYFLQGGSTGIGFTDQGLHIVFTLTGADTYNVTFYSVGSDGPTGLPLSFNGSLGGPAGGGLVDVYLSAFDTGPDAANWQFFNSIAIIPEPSTMLLVCTALPIALLLRRRREGR